MQKKHVIGLPYEQVVRASPLPILITDHRINIVYVNPAWEKLTGYSMQSVLGKHPLFLNIGEQSKIYSEMVTALKKRKIFIIENIRNIKRDGTEYRTHVTMYPLPVAKFQRHMYAQIIHDVTSMQIEYEAMNILNRKISHILNSISDGFIALDKDWKFTYINNRAEELLRHNKEYLLGKSIWKVFPDTIHTDVYTQYNDAFKNQEVTTITLQRPDGRWYQSHIYPSPEGVSVYFNEITSEKLADRRKDEFISIATHEIKTPVTSIRLYSQLLKKKLQHHNDPAMAGLFTKMEAQVERLQKLTANLLDVQRIQDNKMTLHKERISMFSLIKEAVKHVQTLDTHHTIHIESKTRKIVSVDKDRMNEVIYNLLTNAIKYSPEGTDVIINIQKDKKFLIVGIKDSGVGVPEHMKEKIFERFIRVEQQTGKVSGLGLGLYISSEIIKQHGGNMWVESPVVVEKKDGKTVKKGSVFYFSIPV